MPSSLVGTYELKGGSAFSYYNEYNTYALGEKEIAYRIGQTGRGHHSWKGFYVRRDSVLDVLVYFNFYNDGNVGWTSANTRQRRIKLTVREAGKDRVLLKETPPSSSDTFGYLSFNRPVTEVYAEKSDSAQFYPPRPTDCNGYGKYFSLKKAKQKRSSDLTYRAESKVYKLLADHLNSALDPVPVHPDPRKITSATALLKINQDTDFHLPNVNITGNSTSYPTEHLQNLFSLFLAGKLRALKNPNLQDYLLVVMVVREDGVCILPPFLNGFTLR